MVNVKITLRFIHRKKIKMSYVSILNFVLSKLIFKKLDYGSALSALLRHSCFTFNER